MKNYGILIIALMGIMALFMSSGCELTPSGPGDKAPLEPVFDMDIFQTNLESGLGNQWVGYAYVISKNGQFDRSGTFGNWSQGVDGVQPANTTAAVYMASLNKTVAATAVLKAMEQFGSGPATMLNQLILPYLPESWDPDASAASLRWIDVLTHQTGYPNSGSDYMSVKSLIENPGAAANSTFQYSNGNYGLLRILLTSLVGESYTGNDNDNDNLSQSTYIQYITNGIFIPAGIGSARTLQNNVRYYNTSDGTLDRGWPIGDRSANLGAGGFYMSAMDVSHFLAYLNHSETLITNESRQLMFQSFLGLADGPTPTTGDKGTYYTKAGSLSNNGNQGVRNILVIFPNDIEIVFMGNTNGGPMDNTGSLRNMVFNAYDDSWTP